MIALVSVFALFKATKYQIIFSVLKKAIFNAIGMSSRRPKK